ncbi:hypothetical protein V6Z11_A07G149900 [Gossypium hirsutum]
MSKLAKATSTESIEELGLNGSNAAKRLQCLLGLKRRILAPQRC